MKKRKYAMGGMSSEDEFVFDEEMLAEQAKKPTYAESTKLDERDKREMAIQERVREKAQTFGQAFREARKDPEAMKKGYFTYKGKRYSVATKEEAAKKKTSAKKEEGAKKKSDRTQTDPGLTREQARKQAREMDDKKTGSQRLAEKADRAGNIYARGKNKTAKATVTIDDIIGAKKGGMMTKKYNKGGMANCGASVKPNGGSRNK